MTRRMLDVVLLSMCCCQRVDHFLLKVVDEIRTFRRLPKKNMGDSAEDKFVQDKADALDNCNLQLCLMLCYCQWNTC